MHNWYEFCSYVCIYFCPYRRLWSCSIVEGPDKWNCFSLLCYFFPPELDKQAQTLTETHASSYNDRGHRGPKTNTPSLSWTYWPVTALRVCTAHVQQRLLTDYCHFIYFHFSLPAGLVLWLVFSLLPQSYLPEKYRRLPPDRGQKIRPLHPRLEGNTQGELMHACLNQRMMHFFGGDDVRRLIVGGCLIPPGQIVSWKKNGINVLKWFLTASCGERLHTNPQFCSLPATFPLRQRL